MSSGFPFSIFFKLTSQKPVIRMNVLGKAEDVGNQDSLPSSSETSTVNPYTIKPYSYNQPIWYKITGPSYLLLRKLQRESSFKSSVKAALIYSRKKKLARIGGE